MIAEIGNMGGTDGERWDKRSCFHDTSALNIMGHPSIALSTRAATRLGRNQNQAGKSFNLRSHTGSDAGQAAAYMQLAAWEMGVGSCLATLFEPEQARTLLGFPPE